MEVLGNGKAGRKKKLTVEDFLDFTDDRTLPLTVSQLHQIIGMHGFKKIAAQKKKFLAEVVSTMELMDLHRSTLLDGGVSSDASLTLKEVNDDLKSLNWQDCRVTSLLTFGAAGTPVSSAVSLKRKRPRRSGKKEKKPAAAIEVDGDNSVISTAGDTAIVAGSTPETAVDCR